MEIIDVAISSAAGGLAIGFVLGLWARSFEQRLDRRIAFERGHLAGIQFMWPYYLAAERRAAARSAGTSTGTGSHGGGEGKRLAGHAADGDARGG